MPKPNTINMGSGYFGIMEYLPPGVNASTYNEMFFLIHILFVPLSLSHLEQLIISFRKTPTSMHYLKD